MGEEGTELKGPDLAGGVPLGDLQDGEPFVGHIGDEPVVLVRSGEEVFAVGASCTHYGGPLAEGLVVDGTIRCPWHHACFSLRTGEALGAPALNPVPRWSVSVRDGKAYPDQREEREPLAARAPRSTGVGTVVIVGAGAAGAAAAEMLRREGHDGGVLLLDPDEQAPYDRPNLSKDFLAGSAPEEWLPLRPPGFFEEHRIDRVTASVERIDAEARRVRTSDGRDHAFDALLLATGSRAIRPGIPGEERPHVHVLRSLGDCRRIIEGAKRARHAVVVGASFIGMEVAASLRARDLEVTVVAPDSVPFERSLGKELGEVLGELHESHGVAFRLGHTVREITEGEAALDDGTRLPADLVVLGVGVRPDTRLAEGAGIDVDDGVLVNEYLETSRPGIFAAGDIARWPDARSGHRVRFEHWATAQRLGQAAARNILGARLAVRDVPFFWTQQYDLGVRYVGDGGDWDAVRVDGDLGARNATVHYLRDGKMVAAATLHRDRESLAIEADLERARGTR